METRLAEVEHFQNQFILQRNNIDELKHEVNLYVSKLANESHQRGIDSELLAEKTLLNDQ